ncbi:MAG: hypothetical protein HeimC2_04230 [Candidatus Heimdallarchaeota archaeon LC_2]|nr:MAG: hypothetical protein HeimC2_04230 [Candidatus Heimdallarchaeota archaeon LC_2]
MHELLWKNYMSGKPGKLNPRRSSEEIVYAILNYLVQNETSVRLNDIAVEIGSNTKLVQRWLKIINDIQLNSKLTFEDKQGSKISIVRDNSKLLDHKFGIYNTTGNQLQLQNWITNSKSEKKIVFKGNWRIVNDLGSASLIIYDPSNISINKPDNLINKPVLPINNLGNINISKSETFFYVMGWLSSKPIFISKDKNIISMDLLSLLTNNLIAGIFRDEELNHLEELFPLLFTEIGLIDQKYVNYDLDEISIFVQSTAVIIDNNANSANRVHNKPIFWATLNKKNRRRLRDSELGRILISKINYCILNPKSHINIPGNDEDFKEYHIWEILTQFELGNLDVNSKEIEALLSYLNKDRNYVKDTIYNYLGHLFQIEPKKIETEDQKLSSFYQLLKSISHILTNLSNVSTWNWNELGQLLAYYNQVDSANHPIIRIFLLRKLNEFINQKEIKIIFAYQLIKDYLELEIIDHSSVYLNNILGWHIYNGNLQRALDLINFELDNNFQMDQDALINSLLIATFNLDISLIKRLIQSQSLIGEVSQLSKNQMNYLEICNFMLNICKIESTEITNFNLKPPLFTNSIVLVDNVITTIHIQILNIIQKYFLSIHNMKSSDLHETRNKYRALFMETINEVNEISDEIINHKILLNEIVSLIDIYLPENNKLYTFMISLASLLSIQQESNSIIRDKLRSTRRILEENLEPLTFYSLGAFAKLFLAIIRKLGEKRKRKGDEKLTLTKKENQLILRNTFPLDRSIDRLIKEGIDSNELLQFLFLRYLIRSRIILNENLAK